MKFKEIEDNEIYIRESENTFSIAIIANDIKIDNFNGTPTLHLENEMKNTIIINETLESIKNIIKLHILTHRKINTDILIKKLRGDSL